ncbi:hypothetical protein JMA_05500 [Jeotgalibacillus malaysiensis]|uniref:Uncharacterized protein n=1 Tax=Jeotgalibacillus malaysiensis TaxID=1508404 RepID=A0A0B5AMI7_9BACL|nr:hypothetical protein [Jeotgalibacillus malaysiensis]AJD89867.1 hypothetical protein JMA_05500 [Jeotgalibacillus malaysiensis]
MENETAKEKRERLQREELNPETDTTVESPSEKPGRTGIGAKGYLIMFLVVVIAAIIYLLV